jgi:hypothetical protein
MFKVFKKSLRSDFVLCFKDFFFFQIYLFDKIY